MEFVPTGKIRYKGDFMTEKLYYLDAYISEFSARVISSECAGDKNLTVLDKTAFFPEEGGQSADRGFIGEARVLDAFEKDGTVYHVTDRILPEGEVLCRLDFAARYEKMQCHTAEHILCGIIHNRFGLDNVGFHLGDEIVTFDINAQLSESELYEIEEAANRAVFDCLPVTAAFPNREELDTLSYRAKLELRDGVRIVKIGDIDACACCAPHVKNTGEIGLIKIVDFMKHRGGTRIFMVAGRRALNDYRATLANLKRVSAALSVPRFDAGDAFFSYARDIENREYAMKTRAAALAGALADSLDYSLPVTVKYISGIGMDELRAFVNSAQERLTGTLVALCGNEGDYKYIITSKTENLSARAKEINSALGGRGGGKPEAIQGSFSATLSEIFDYFK